MSSRRIAFISLSVVGTGDFSQGIPVLSSFVREVSLKNEVIVFSLSSVNPGYKTNDYTLLSPSKGLSMLGKCYWLMTTFFLQYKEKKIHIIHAFWGYPSGIFSAVIKLILKIPLIIHLQGGDSVYLADIKYGIFGNRVIAMFARWAYNLADELVVLTNFQKAKLTENFKGKLPKVIPFGVDNDIFNDSDCYKKLKAPYRFLHIAHISPVKNQKLLLDAFKEILQKVDSELKMFGCDTLDGKIHQYANEIGIASNVHFLGDVPHKEVISQLKNTDLLIHTSFYEAQGIAISEAIASGVAVCGTDVGLISDLEKICTITSPVGEKNKLVQNVLNLIVDSDLYNKKVEEGIVWSKEHDIHWTVGEFEKLYDKHACSG